MFTIPDEMLKKPRSEKETELVKFVVAETLKHVGPIIQGLEAENAMLRAMVELLLACQDEETDEAGDEKGKDHHDG